MSQKSYEAGREDAFLEVYDLIGAAWSRTAANYSGIPHSGEEAYCAFLSIKNLLTDRLALGRFSYECDYLDPRLERFVEVWGNHE